jgi:aminoglycoside phosphotransferase family enzyme
MTQANLPQFIQALLDPAAYPHPAGDIRLVQTHISYVLLAGDFVYKFKKPVNFGFLDFYTLEKRKVCCEQELLLNRRLCPEIYLDLVTVTREGGSYHLNGRGEVAEYGVRMARMPEERMMGRVIAAGELTKAHLDALVAVLVPFYERAEHGPAIDRFGTAEAVAVNVLENFAQTEG